MHDIKDLRLSNMRELINSPRFAGNKTAFARSIDRPAPNIHRLLKSEVRIGEDLARDIEARLNLPVGWMDEPHGEAADVANVAETRLRVGQVPLISWVAAGDWTEAIDIYQPGDAGEWVSATVQVRRHTFALRVQGDSMEPDFKEGTILIVEPDIAADVGDLVIAKNGDNEATFKQLVKDAGDWYLKPLNPRYPIKPLGDSKIIGVIRESIRRHK